MRDGGQGAELLDCTDSVTNHHVPVLSAVVNRCDESYLCLDVSKTKDVSTDFRKENVQPQLTIIHSETVDSVDRFKYLGMVMDSKQKFGNNCDIIFKKGLAATALSEKTQIF